MRYEDGKPVEIERVLISTQHADGSRRDSRIRPDLLEHVVEPVLPAELYDDGAPAPRRCSSTRPAASSSAARSATPA